MDFIIDLAPHYLRIDLHWKIAAYLLGMFSVFPLWRKYRAGHISLLQGLSAAVLIVYMFLVFSSTVFSRSSRPEYQYELELFWSWRRVFKEHSRIALEENLYNIIMLMPYGLLFPIAVRSRSVRRPNALFTILTGFGCSATIEVLQLLFKRGLFEFDDMIHNTLGVIIGYGLYFAVFRSRRRS